MGRVSFPNAVCGRMAAATLPARRPSAGAVPGRWGACLAVRAPPAALFATQKSLSETTSPPARVISAARVRRLIPFVTYRTPPSTNTTLAPPVWKA